MMSMTMMFGKDNDKKSTHIPSDTGDDDAECKHISSITSKLICILSYGGNWNDMIINYTLIVSNLWLCFVVLSSSAENTPRTSSTTPTELQHVQHQNEEIDDDDNGDDDGEELQQEQQHHQDQQQSQQTRRKQSYAIRSFGFVVVIQIVLCLILGCSGVSIIWSAMLGWIISEERQRSQQQQLLPSTPQQRYKLCYNCILLIDVAAIVYYAVVSEPITTVAHVCAIILGALLSLISMKNLENNNSGNENDDDGNNGRGGGSGFFITTTTPLMIGEERIIGKNKRKGD